MSLCSFSGFTNTLSVYKASTELIVSTSKKTQNVYDFIDGFIVKHSYQTHLFSQFSQESLINYKTDLDHQLYKSFKLKAIAIQEIQSILKYQHLFSLLPKSLGNLTLPLVSI